MPTLASLLFLCQLNLKANKIGGVFDITRHNSNHFDTKRKIVIWHNLLSIQNEAISLVAMRSKEFGSGKSSHCQIWMKRRSLPWKRKLTPIQRIKLNRTELRNPIITYKMLENSSHFLLSEHYREPKKPGLFLEYCKKLLKPVGKLVRMQTTLSCS